MTLLILIAGLAGLVWGIIFALRGSLIVGCLGFLLAVCCFGHPLVNFKLGTVTLTIDRLLLALLAISYVVQRQLGKTEPKPWTRSEGLLAVFIGLLVVSTFTSDWRTELPNQVPPLWRLIGGYLVPCSLFWMARQAPLGSRQVTMVQGFLAVFGIYLAVTGLLEVNRQWAFVFPKYIADPKIGLHFGRARGPMIQSISFGFYLSTCLLASWVWRRELGRFGRLAWLLPIPLYLAGLYLSYTRSVWMGAALGLLTVLAVTLEGRARKLVVGGLLAAGLLLAATRYESLLNLDREDSARGSAEARGGFAYLSWKMFQDRPLWGFGFGQFYEAKLPYLSDRSSEFNLEQLRSLSHHNTFLSLLTETGAPGLALFLALLASWAANAWRLCRSREAPRWVRGQGALMLGVLGAYVCQAAFHEMSYSSTDHALLFFLAGLTAGLTPWTSVASVRSAPRIANYPSVSSFGRLKQALK